MTEDLRKAAKAATPGPWQLSGVRHRTAPALGRDTRLLEVGPDGDGLAMVFFDMETGKGHADARFIALANPAAILALYAERDAALTAAMGEEKPEPVAHRWRYPAGEWHYGQPTAKDLVQTAGFEPLFTHPSREDVVEEKPAAPLRLAIERKVGMTGAAYDGPNDARAYTYKHQPGNAPAWRIGEAAINAAKERGGDCIDSGLALLRHLEMAGFGVFSLVKDEPAHPSREDVVEECAKHLESIAKKRAEFVADNAHRMHPMRAPSGELERALEDAAHTEQKFRAAAAAIRKLKERS